MVLCACGDLITEKDGKPQAAYHWSNIMDDRDRATIAVFRNAQVIEDRRQDNPATDVKVVVFPVVEEYERHYGRRR